MTPEEILALLQLIADLRLQIATQQRELAKLKEEKNG